MALGKNTTLGKIEDIVRFKTGTVNDNLLTATMMLDLNNYHVGDLAKKLSEMNAPFYMDDDTITLSGSAYPISSLKVDKIIKLVDGTLGIIKFVSPEEYERAASFTNQYGSSLLAVQEGEQIRIFKGASLGSHGTLTLYYYRSATHGASRSAFPDLPDAYTGLLIKSVCSDVYAYKNNGQRNTALDTEISKDLEELRNGFLMGKVA